MHVLKISVETGNFGLESILIRKPRGYNFEKVPILERIPNILRTFRQFQLIQGKDPIQFATKDAQTQKSIRIRRRKSRLNS